MTERRSPYYLGAKAGIAFGIYLSFIFVAMVLSSTIGFMSIVMMGLLVCMPVAVYRSLRRSFVESRFEASFSELWVQGIAMFLFGSAICGLITMIYMKWIAPGYLVDQVLMAIKALRAGGSPEQLEYARILSNMINEGIVPSPSTFVISMFWMTMAGGSLLSMVMASIARIGKKMQRDNQPSMS